MLSRRNLVAIAAMAFGLAVVASNSSSAFAAPVAPRNNDRVRLFAFMSAGPAKSRARYLERNNGARRKFDFQAENATPGQVLTVSAGGTVVGTATIDSFRRGKFELDTALGHTVPKLSVGTLIEVRIGGKVVMSGQLR